MDERLKDIEVQAGRHRDFESPPLHLWHPPLSGSIPICIRSDGKWYHEGDLVRRQSLVALFASILRRESDSEYYLVTPSEKWRIQVDLHPLMVTDIEVVGEGEGQELEATLNTGKRLHINEDHSLFTEPSVGGIAAINLPHGLTALFTRAAWYRLVDMADQTEGVTSVRSAGETYILG